MIDPQNAFFLAVSLFHALLMFAWLEEGSTGAVIYNICAASTLLGLGLAA